MQITWKEYQARKNEIWNQHLANKDLTHQQRGALIAADLRALPPVRKG